MKKWNLLFWQPRTDFLRLLSVSSWGRLVVIVFNYSIWIYLFYVSYQLIAFQTNIFWQILFATILGELVEKYGKRHALWRRPLFTRHDQTPPGLVKKWYQTGSFPSGHTIKAVFFFLFILQYGVISPIQFLAVAVPLIFFRVLVGFHYPADIFGGAFFGWLIWILTSWIVLPRFLTNVIHVIFNFVFQIK